VTVTESRRGAPVAEVEPIGPGPVEPEAELVEAEEPGLVRYSLFERILHWVVAITFVALLLSGLALAYPRLAWLSGLFGGGQTMRAAHPWIGLVFTAGLLLMLVIWARSMWLGRADWAWFRNLRDYTRRGHVAVDSGRWNGGQKGYYWASLVLGIVLLVTGIPLWFPSIAGAGIDQLSRLIHHVAFLLMVAGFIIHVLLSAFLFPGTMAGMTSGRVTPAWAAWHHPRWYREQVAQERSAAEDASPPEPRTAEETRQVDAETAEARAEASEAAGHDRTLDERRPDREL
jgi:formate dehydrogenase subunit gamma